MIKRIMEHKQRLSIIALAVTLSSQSAWAVDLNKRLDVSTDTREPVFGQIYYDYHMGQRFSALNAILLEKNKGMFSDEDPETESILGDLYTEFGLPREADVALSRVQAQDIPSSTRNMPWLRYADYLSKLGNDVTTENYLRKPPQNLTNQQESQRRLLLSNVLIRKKNYAEAISLLLDMPTKGATGSYGLYNLGVSYIQEGQVDLGIKQLNDMIRLANNDNESLDLKDKAALTIAHRYLQDGNYAGARDSLMRIRLKGPYSNAALLALSYSYYLNNQYQEALPAALELHARNPADPAVQEAFLLASRIYEDVGANNQALSSYRVATMTLRDQLLELERTARRIDEEKWPDVLSPMRVNSNESDPLNIKVIPATNDAVIAGLFAKLFASSQFHEQFKSYRQLQRMQELLDVRLRDLAALEQVSTQLEARKAQLPELKGKLTTLRDAYANAIKNWQNIQLRTKQMANNADFYTEAATQAETARLQQINRLSRKVNKLGLDEKQAQELSNRLDRLRDLTQFEVARHAGSRDEMYQRIQEATEQLRDTKQRLSALESLVADNQMVIDKKNSTKFATMRNKIAQLKEQIAVERKVYQTHLRGLAKDLLEEHRQRLTTYITETYLGMERVEQNLAPAPTKASDKL
ncbi:MAG: tetratricopeptide repeat protein [Moraxellaceae bacterium]|nr:tetratricopeptide repeat protein [Moraxellaceae bacterium]